MTESTPLCDKKLCGCDIKVPYYNPQDRLHQIAECKGCGQEINLYVLSCYINESVELKSICDFIEK